MAGVFLVGERLTVEIELDRVPDMDALIRLFEAAGWHDKTERARLGVMLANSTVVATAWDGAEMVGFGRCCTDRAFNGQINNVVVDARYRGRGVGRRLVEAMLESDARVTFVLRADADNAGFYRKIGFKGADLAFIFERRC
jgi:ribosomal protein S18 acetylase RimI-like enzyme